jgi:hypothetical protein
MRLVQVSVQPKSLDLMKSKRPAVNALERCRGHAAVIAAVISTPLKIV